MRTVRQLLFLVMLLVLAACDNESIDTAPDIEADVNQPISFEIGFALQTRISMAADYGSQWSTDDEVGVYITKGSAQLAASGNYVDNMKMTYTDSGSWTYTLPTGKEYYPKDGETLSFYAYYPYDAALADPTSITFSVQTDQSTAEAFGKSQLMMATKQNVTKSNNPVALAFQQKMAMLKVKVVNGTDPGETAPAADEVIMKLLLPKTTLNLATGAITDDYTGRTDIKMHYNTADECWYGIVAPNQQINNGTHLLDLTWTNLITLKHTHSGTSYTFFPEQVKPLEITIQVTLDPNHAYAVGDVYPHKGFPMGVVYEVSNGGKNGKIVGINETVLAWARESVETNANKRSNGRENMIVIKTLDATFSDYPAFGWVHAKNPANTIYTANATGIWYLPAQDEVVACLNQGVVINNTLQSKSWTELRGSFWSSTEVSNSSSLRIQFSDKMFYPYPKTNSNNVRAVLEF